MKKLLVSIVLITSLISCTKSIKLTTSKVKILGSGAFSVGSILETKANNGMIFYGHNNNGHQFVQLINSDSLDLTLPNGTWDFYTVAWENASPTSPFQGSNSCGKQKGVVLNGSDTSLSITISNTNCNDTDFSSGVSTVGGVYRLPYKDVNTCRDLSGVSSYASTCERGIGDLAPQRGFATYARVFIPQYKNIGNGYEIVGAPLLSGCMEIDPDLASGESVSGSTKASGTVLASSLSFPDLNASLKYGVRVYFSKDACDDANSGSIDIPVAAPETALSKTFTNSPTMSLATRSKIFVQTNQGMVCKDNRLTTDLNFAGGRGTKYSPFQICTAAQFNKIQDLFSDGTYYTQNKSFELLADLDFNFGTINPIGGALNTTPSAFGGSSSSDRNVFDGNGHKIANALIKCEGYSTVGLIRTSNNLYIQNMSLEKIVLDCESLTSIGALIGEATATYVNNVNVRAHINGGMYSAGLIGHFANGDINNAQVNAVVKTSANFAGGIVGRVYIDSIQTNITNSSFKGEVKASSGEVGGIAGGVVCGMANCFIGDKLVVKANLTAAIGNMGGLFGSFTSSGNLALSDMYFEGNLIQKGYGTYSGNMGGLFGTIQVPVTVYNSFALAQKHLDTSGVSSVGGAFGYETSAGITNCTNVYYFKDNTNYNSSSTCNDNSSHEKEMPTLITAMNTVANIYPSVWRSSNGGLPRLADEGIKMMASWLDESTCDGHFTQATILGNGTVTTPYLICSPEQFSNISAGNVYVLKKNIFLDKTVSLSPLPSGAYFIDGENHFVSGAKINPTTTGYSGLFSLTLPGSYLKNFTLFGPSLNLSGAYTTDFGVGILVGYNKGTISNVLIRNGVLDASSGFSTTIDSGSNNYIGGLVGINGSAGVINKVRLDTKVNYIFSATGTHAASSLIGGVVGLNGGTVESLKMNGVFYVNPQTLASNQFAGVIASSNPGTLRGIDVENDVQVSATSTTSLSKVAMLAYNNLGLIEDVTAEPSMSFTNIIGLTSPLLVNLQSTGLMKRTIFDLGTISGLTPSSSSTLMPSTGVTESFCVHPSAAGCMNSETGQYSFSSGIFSAGSFVSNSSDWNMVISDLPNMNYVWSYGDSDNYPSLMRTGGSWEELDFGM